MRTATSYRVAILLALVTGGCGGTGGTSANSAGVTSSSSCLAVMPFVGATPHAPLPASLFPVTASKAATDVPVPDALAAALDQQVHDLLNKSGAPAISAAITVPGLGRWSSTQGLAQVRPAQAVTHGTEFYWGSVAKTLTAVLVLQLMEEGKLRLEDPLSRWLPQIPDAQHIRIGHLLSHTSGLQTNANSRSGEGPVTPTSMATNMAGMPLLFCPGTSASYSNTGYVLLALVVEAIEQQPLHQTVERRIAKPLGLQYLRALRPGEDAAVALAIPHEGQTPMADPTAWTRLGAGNVVGRAEDLAVFWQAVLTGRLLAPATVQSQWEMLHVLGPQTTETSQALQWFGKGVMLMEWTDPTGRERAWLGHLGGIPTANAVLLYDPVAGAYAAVAVNNDVSSAAAANSLIKTVLEWRAQH